MISKKYPEFLMELNAMKDYLSEEVCVRLGITTQQRGSVIGAHKKFAAIMALYDNPSKKTAAVVQDCGKVYTETGKVIANFRQAVKATNKGKLMGEDFQNLFIHKDKTTHTRHTHIDELPSLAVKEHKGLTIDLAVTIVGQEIPARPALPEFVRTLRLDWTYDDNELAPKQIIGHTENFGTASPKLVLDETQLGKYCHVVAYYVLPDGTKSDPSLKLSFVASAV